MATIILIPGLMNDAWVWSGQLGALSRVGPLFVACNDGLDSLESMAERILAATAGPLFVAGHSMGGRVALEMVAQAPDRVAALALLSTGAHGPRDTEAEGRLKLVHLAETQGIAAVIESWLPPMLGPGTSAEARAGIEAMLLRASPQILCAQQHALLHRPDRSGLLATIACPTLVMTGEEDRWSTPAQHADLAGAIRDAALEIVRAAGHMLPVEAAEQVGARLANFFARC